MPKILAALTDVDGEDFAGYLVVVNIPETDRLNVEEFLLGQQD